jgi:hypothetical protein
MERNSWQVPHPNKQTNTRNQQTSRGPEEGGERRGPGGGGGGGLPAGRGRTEWGGFRRGRDERGANRRRGDRSMGLWLRLVGRLVGFTSGAALAFQVHALLVWVGPDVRVGHILCSTGPTRLPCCSGGPHFVLNWTTICHWHAEQEKIRERRTVYARDRRTHAQLLLSYMLCAVA